MPRQKITLLLTTVFLAFGAGLVLGWVWTPLQRVQGMTKVETNSAPRPWFEQLELNADQRRQIEQIWSDARLQMQKQFEGRRELERQRDQQVRALLNADQLAAYEKISEDFHRHRGEAEKRRDSIMVDANARSRALLDDAQQKKWDALQKQMQHGGWRNSPGMQNHATTRPNDGKPDDGGPGKPE